MALFPILVPVHERRKPQRITLTNIRCRSVLARGCTGRGAGSSVFRPSIWPHRRNILLPLSSSVIRRSPLFLNMLSIKSRKLTTVVTPKKGTTNNNIKATKRLTEDFPPFKHFLLEHTIMPPYGIRLGSDSNLPPEDNPHVALPADRDFVNAVVKHFDEILDGTDPSHYPALGS